MPLDIGNLPLDTTVQWTRSKDLRSIVVKKWMNHERVHASRIYEDVSRFQIVLFEHIGGPKTVYLVA